MFIMSTVIVSRLVETAGQVFNAFLKLRFDAYLRGEKITEVKPLANGKTLDVVIADNMGTRNYELYSGGEAFKVDFSLRLALSRLLTNRASAKLQTLIIDEGFGSQDSEGRERLVEVIRSIESEFELMLVVTHLDELKESLPAQIQVYKDEEGSHVSLVA